MLQSAWLFIGTLAIITTTGALLVQDDAMAIILGVAGFLTWGFFAYGALDVRVSTEAVTYSYSLPSVTILAVGFAIIPGFIALTGPTELVGRAREARPEDL